MDKTTANGSELYIKNMDKIEWMYKAYFGVVPQMETAYPAKKRNDSKYEN